MNNQRILSIIAVLMLGIFIMMAYDFNSRKHQTLGDSVDEAVEEVEDEIDDHTTSSH